MSSIRAEMSGDTDALLQRLNKLKSLEKRGVLNSIAEGLRTSTYAPGSEGGIAWDDPALAIDWRLPAGEILLSEKDRRHPKLADAPELFEYDRP